MRGPCGATCDARPMRCDLHCASHAERAAHAGRLVMRGPYDPTCNERPMRRDLPRAAHAARLATRGPCCATCDMRTMRRDLRCAAHAARLATRGLAIFSKCSALCSSTTVDAVLIHDIQRSAGTHHAPAQHQSGDQSWVIKPDWLAKSKQPEKAKLWIVATCDARPMRRDLRRAAHAARLAMRGPCCATCDARPMRRDL